MKVRAISEEDRGPYPRLMIDPLQRLPSMEDGLSEDDQESPQELPQSKKNIRSF